MEFKVLEEKDNSLFNRKEVYGEIIAKSVPSHSETEKLVSEKFSISPEAIKIKKIEGHFGTNNFMITVFIYNSKEEKDSIEPKPKTKKKQ